MLKFGTVGINSFKLLSSSHQQQIQVRLMSNRCKLFCNYFRFNMPRWRSRQRVSLIIWRSWVRASHGAAFVLLKLHKLNKVLCPGKQIDVLQMKVIYSIHLFTGLQHFPQKNSDSIWLLQQPRWRSRQRVSLIIWRSWVRASHGAQCFWNYITVV